MYNGCKLQRHRFELCEEIRCIHRVTQFAPSTIRHQVGIFSFSHTSCIFLGRVPCYVFYTTVDPMIDLHLYHLASASPNSSCRFLNVSLDKGGIFLDPTCFEKYCFPQIWNICALHERKPKYVQILFYVQKHGHSIHKLGTLWEYNLIFWIFRNRILKIWDKQGPTVQRQREILNSVTPVLKSIQGRLLLGDCVLSKSKFCNCTISTGDSFFFPTTPSKEKYWLNCAITLWAKDLKNIVDEKFLNHKLCRSVDRSMYKSW